MQKNNQPPLNILLVGYGKMGHMLHQNESIAGNVTQIYDPNIPEYCTPLSERDLASIDVAIEFTRPECAFDNICLLLSHNIPTVTGTTGWLHRLSELSSKYSSDTHSLIYGANFSIGMNIFFAIVETATKLLSPHLYDVYGLEMHHKQKLDAPSGTAKTLADIINSVGDNGNSPASLSPQISPLQKNQLVFSSVRAGSIVGYHEVGFDSEYDEIKLTHNAKNRLGFAQGALVAATIAVRQTGFYDFREVIKATR